MSAFFLASKSPRRLELLAQCGFYPRVLPVEVAEQPRPDESPRDYALSVAQAKARAGALIASEPIAVLAADTDVSVDGRILGKPRDREDAIGMLSALSGRWHEVCSAVVLRLEDREESRLSVTRVRFGDIDPAIAAAYWDSGEPADKAGAYAIQGWAACWVAAIDGSYSGVVGLPLFETCELLSRFGIMSGPR